MFSKWYTPLWMHTWMCVCVCVHVCVCAWKRERERICVWVCVCERACVRACMCVCVDWGGGGNDSVLVHAAHWFCLSIYRPSVTDCCLSWDILAFWNWNNISIAQCSAICSCIYLYIYISLYACSLCCSLELCLTAHINADCCSWLPGVKTEGKKSQLWSVL